MPAHTPTSFDVVVIGAGFGGLGAALALAEQGARVAVCEALKYPGGCASTFTRGGASYESGATLMSGLGDGQLFGRWLARYGSEVHVEWIDPIVELRTPALKLDVTRDRARLVDAIAAASPVHADGIRAFFAEQARTADVLWNLFDDPSLLPPWNATSLARLAKRGLSFVPLARLVGRPLGARMRAHGVEDCAPLRVFADALCQITIQCSAAEAEAPFAYGAMDYYWRGTGHVRGGVGVLAWALARALEGLGATVSMANRARAIVREDGGWRVETRKGTFRARTVIANVLPSALDELLSGRSTSFATRAIGRDVDASWGAAMLYATATSPPGSRAEAHHLELVDDADAPFAEGNHLFVSISGADEAERAPDGRRTLTISTHVPLDLGAAVTRVHERMRTTLALRAPEWSEAIVTSMTASPRTFERFTGRPRGAVGGAPRRAGLHNYRRLGPHEADRDLWLVGDSIFPGQSTLAAAIGGVRTAAAVAARYHRR